MTETWTFRGAAARLDDTDLPRIGALIGVGEDEIHAFIEVESRGAGFAAQGRPIILYEPHVAFRCSTGAKRQADLPDVPLVTELVTNPDDRQAIAFLSFQQEMGRPFLMPPGTPAHLVAIMRRAFDDTMKDSLFLADAEKALMEVDPMTGEEMQRIIANAFATPKALLQRALQLHGGSAQ